MHRLLHALGDPHLRVPVVHVAGTKGKGSTVAMLSSIVQAAHYNVGTYTRCACSQTHYSDMWPMSPLQSFSGRWILVSMLLLNLHGCVIVFCSPHVTTLRERISINGQPIPETSFDDLIRDVETKLVRSREEEGGALSHFEVMTALAFTHFQGQQVYITDILCAECQCAEGNNWRAWRCVLHPVLHGGECETCECGAG